MQSSGQILMIVILSRVLSQPTSHGIGSPTPYTLKAFDPAPNTAAQPEAF